MIEYIYNAIRATAGQEICICALITDDEGNALTNGCGLMLHDKDNKEMMIARVNGAFDGEEWSFVIPAEVTQGLKGRYWYCICSGDKSLCFKEPIYLV